MSYMVTNVYVKFTYDRLLIYKALGNFRKSDNNNKKNNVRSTCIHFSDTVNLYKIAQTLCWKGIYQIGKVTGSPKMRDGYSG